MELATYATSALPTALNAHLQHVLHVRSVTSYKMAHAHSAQASTPTALLATISIAFHAKTVTFWKITLVITVPQLDFLDAIHVTPPNVYLVIQVTYLTSAQGGARPVNPSSRSAFSAILTIVNHALVGIS
jgi:hypothetical protein